MVIPILPRVVKIKVSFSLFDVLSAIPLNQLLTRNCRSCRIIVYFFYSQLSAVVLVNSV
jgi:hypothetical protein